MRGHYSSWLYGEKQQHFSGNTHECQKCGEKFPPNSANCIKCGSMEVIALRNDPRFFQCAQRGENNE
ncbi:MAG: hypothetical protein WC682_04185 [Parcubacteria group bacterium]|jgi:uncharacterized OB-fold protein